MDQSLVFCFAGINDWGWAVIWVSDCWRRVTMAHVVQGASHDGLGAV
jgi:hypothetical protein